MDGTEGMTLGVSLGVPSILLSPYILPVIIIHNSNLMCYIAIHVYIIIHPNVYDGMCSRV